MIKINTTLHTGEVPISTGSIVTCDFLSKRLRWNPDSETPSINKYEAEVGLYINKNYTKWQEDSDHVISSIDEIVNFYGSMVITLSLNKTEYNNLSNLSALGIIKDKLEAIPEIGVGNCQIIDPETGA